MRKDSARAAKILPCGRSCNGRRFRNECHGFLDKCTGVAGIDSGVVSSGGLVLQDIER